MLIIHTYISVTLIFLCFGSSPSRLLHFVQYNVSVGLQILTVNESVNYDILFS